MGQKDLVEKNLEFYPDVQKMEKEEGGVTMCELLDKYEARGMEKAMLVSIRNLMETTKWNVEQVMDALKIPNSERGKFLEMI